MRSLPLDPRHLQKLDVVVKEMRRHFPQADRVDAIRLLIDEVNLVEVLEPVRRGVS